MKKRFAVLLVVVAVANLSWSEETTFHGVKLADVKGKQAEAALTFSDERKTVTINIADRELVAIPYAQLDKVSYEYTKKHRITQGAFVMLASLGAGAIVMMTKSKSHWLYIDYRDHEAAKTVVLRMDKHEYHKIFEAVKTHTGKEVQFVGDAAKVRNIK